MLDSGGPDESRPLRTDAPIRRVITNRLVTGRRREGDADPVGQRLFQAGAG